MLVRAKNSMTLRRYQRLARLCLGIFLCGVPALAEEADDLFRDLVPEDSQALAQSQGGADDELSLAELGASVVGNSITGTVTTGSATIGGDAFSDLNGVSSVLVNSGNNVSIQSSTVVNIVIYE